MTIATRSSLDACSNPLRLVSCKRCHVQTEAFRHLYIALKAVRGCKPKEQFSQDTGTRID